MAIARTCAGRGAPPIAAASASTVDSRATEAADAMVLASAWELRYCRVVDSATEAYSGRRHGPSPGRLRRATCHALVLPGETAARPAVASGARPSRNQDTDFAKESPLQCR